MRRKLWISEGAEGKGSKNNMTPEVIAVMKMTMLKAGLSMAFMSSLVNIGSLTLQTAIKPTGTGYYSSSTRLPERYRRYSWSCLPCSDRLHGDLLWAEYRSGRSDQSEKGIKLAIFYTCIWCTMAIIASYTIGPWLVKLVTGTNNPIIIKMPQIISNLTLCFIM